MKKIAKRGLILIIISVLFLTTVYAGSVLIKSKDKGVEMTVNDLLKEYSSTYGSEIIYGTQLYVWSGDKDFDPKEFSPTGGLSIGEVIEYESGNIDLTPGATSPIIYKITSKSREIKNVSYKLYLITAVSRRGSATVRSETQDKVIWGISKSKNYSGYVPTDYSENGALYEESKELTILKDSVYIPKNSFVNYNPEDYVVEIQEDNLDTSKVGTYKLVYSVSPIKDFNMEWKEVYTVNVVDNKSENKGMRVVAEDTAIHAIVTDNNSYDSEVYMGNEYNLNAGVKQITVHKPRRSENAYADIEVYKNGKKVDKNEIIKSEKTVDNDYVIEFYNKYDYTGYEVRLSNQKVLDTLDKLNSVGGWSDTSNEGIIVDKEPEESKVKSFIMSFSTNVFAAESELTNRNLGQGVLSSKNPTCTHRTTGVVDGVAIYFNKSKLVDAIEGLVDGYNLEIVDTSTVQSSINAGCIDEGKWGYNSLSNSYVTVYAFLYKNGSDYYVRIQATYYKGDIKYQRLRGYFTVPLEPQTCSVKVKKTTDNGNKGVVKGARFGVYTSKKKANSDSGRLFTLEVKDSTGVAIATKKQAAQLSVGKTYWVKEVYAPKGTDLNETPVSFTTASGKTSTVKIKNPSWWFKLAVHKKEKGSNTSLAGAEFTLYEWDKDDGKYKKSKDADGTGVFKTDSTGYFESGGQTGKLYYTAENQGKWRLIETKNPINYKGTASKDFPIKKSNKYSTKTTTNWIWTVENGPVNVKPGKISIQKKVENTVGGKLTDVSKDHNVIAKFYIYDSAKAYVTSITTNSSGYGITGDLQISNKTTRKATYYIKEVSCAEGMDPVYTDLYPVEISEGQVTALNFGISERNKPGIQTEWDLGAKVQKLDAVTRKPLKDAKFTFYEWNGSTYTPIKKANGDYLVLKSGDDGWATVTSDSGYLRWTKTNEGRFAVSETEAPTDYIVTNPYMKTFMLTSENKYTEVNFEFLDVAYGQFEFQKEIIDLTGKSISSAYDFSNPSLGIKYTLYKAIANEDNAYDIGEKVVGYENITLDKNGKFESGKLAPGYYWLEEHSLNIHLFSNKPGAKFIFRVDSGNITLLSGSKGVSYDNGKSWNDSIFK